MSRPRIKPLSFSYTTNEGFVTQISTNTTDEYPKVVFIRTKVRLTPTLKERGYEDEVLKIKKKFEAFATERIKSNTNFENEFLFNVTVAEKSVQYDKNSHVRYDLFLKPIQKVTMNDIKEKLESVANKLNNELYCILRAHNIKTY